MVKYFNCLAGLLFPEIIFLLYIILIWVHQYLLADGLLVFQLNFVCIGVLKAAFGVLCDKVLVNLSTRAYSRNIKRHSIFKKSTFYAKKGDQPLPYPPYSIPFLSVLHQNKALHNFRKSEQYSIGVEYALSTTFPIKSLVTSVIFLIALFKAF